MLLQFEAFARGFMTLCGGPAIHLFSATELERLVCGNPILDFEALQANARYDGGYSAEHRVSAVPAGRCKHAACAAPLQVACQQGCAGCDRRQSVLVVPLKACSLLSMHALAPS